MVKQKDPWRVERKLGVGFFFMKIYEGATSLKHSVPINTQIYVAIDNEEVVAGGAF